eukprot:CAMPEP_0178601974 /NCGR_PEP_ID=MMETSP0697-20121206/34691_1 /TAXON_ID=265572 /ORGANISM="Extubocellulus spinifer, Strain CCMP396" /LENGTH=46 /DNA_ID= /DNA_START= /DNA_END= /DNA_ORIENTATION=
MKPKPKQHQKPQAEAGERTSLLPIPSAHATAFSEPETIIDPSWWWS